MRRALALGAGLPGCPVLAVEAVRRAEQAVTLHDPLVLWSRVAPFWESIREHPRFAAVVRPVWA